MDKNTGVGENHDCMMDAESVRIECSPLYELSFFSACEIKYPIVSSVCAQQQRPPTPISFAS